MHITQILILNSFFDFSDFNSKHVILFKLDNTPTL